MQITRIISVSILSLYTTPFRTPANKYFHFPLAVLSLFSSFRASSMKSGTLSSQPMQVQYGECGHISCFRHSYSILDRKKPTTVGMELACQSCDTLCLSSYLAQISPYVTYYACVGLSCSFTCCALCFHRNACIGNRHIQVNHVR